MKTRLWLAAACCLWAVTCYAQTSAVRPAQMTGGTPNVTVTVPAGSNTVQIGTTVPWRTDVNAAATVCTGAGTGNGPNSTGCTASDNATAVELNFNGAITATLPDATGVFGSGTGFTIQVGPGTLTLTRASASTINGATSITAGPYQSVGLSSRGGNWYASLSVAGTLPPPTAAAWNPSDKDTSMTLSTTATTNDTATQTGGAAAGSWRMVRATAPSYATGTAHKVVVLFTPKGTISTGGATQAGQIFGVADNGTSASTGQFPGHFTNSWGVESGSPGGGDWKNGTSSTTGCTTTNFVAGSNVYLAIDFNTGNLWCSANCTSWQGGGTPAAATSPSATLTSATYFIAWGANSTGATQDAVQLNAAPSLGSCTGLTGFNPWNTG